MVAVTRLVPPLLLTVVVLAGGVVALPTHDLDTKDGEGKAVHQGTTTQKPPVPTKPTHDLLRPLENFVDRFLKSETIGVVDSIAAQAIEAFASFVDNAGVAVVDIIEALPDTIDRVSDTVDDLAKSADNLGKELALMLEVSGHDHAHKNIKIYDVNIRRNASTHAHILNSHTHTDRLNTHIQNTSNNNKKNSSRKNTSHDSFADINNLSSLSRSADVVARSDLDLTDSNTISGSGGGKSVFDSSRNRVDFVGFGALGSSFTHHNDINTNNNNGNTNNNNRRRTVFERNFENSRTQSSIRRLEEEFGGFLGRLLGTIYRNADNIDESLSSGLRRVLGIRSPTTTTTTEGPTTPKIHFRLTFDDIAPAPAHQAHVPLAR